MRLEDCVLALAAGMVARNGALKTSRRIRFSPGVGHGLGHRIGHSRTGMSTTPSSAPVRKRKTSPRKGATRAPLERLYHIHGLLRDGRYPNCTRLARELEVDRKTILRDMEWMRSTHRLPVEWDQQKNGYYYSVPVDRFPIARAGSDELLALYLARSALEPLRGTQLAETLGAQMRKMAGRFSEEVSFAWHELDEAFSVRTGGTATADSDVFRELSKALIECREARFTYRKSGIAEPEERRVEPWHLSQVDGGWYLFGLDLDRNALRTFALPRIGPVFVMKRQFDRPADFDLARHLADSFGVWGPSADGKRTPVRLRFTGYAAQQLRERVWHPSQKLHPGPDAESVEATFMLGRLEELERWILSWGTNVEVLSPPSLRARIAGIAREVSARHDPET